MSTPHIFPLRAWSGFHRLSTGCHADARGPALGSPVFLYAVAAWSRQPGLQGVIGLRGVWWGVVVGLGHPGRQETVGRHGRGLA